MILLWPLRFAQLWYCSLSIHHSFRAFFFVVAKFRNEKCIYTHIQRYMTCDRFCHNRVVFAMCFFVLAQHRGSCCSIALNHLHFFVFFAYFLVVVITDYVTALKIIVNYIFVLLYLCIRDRATNSLSLLFCAYTPSLLPIFMYTYISLYMWQHYFILVHGRIVIQRLVVARQ